MSVTLRSTMLVLAALAFATLPILAQGAHFGGTQSAAALPFISWGGVLADSAGNVYVADDSDRQVVEYTAAGSSLEIPLGNGGTPEYMALDRSGNLYVTTNGPNSVVKIAAGSHTATTIATNFSRPWGIAVDSHTNIFVADHATGDIYKLTQNSSGSSYVQSSFVPPGLLNSPVQMAIDSGDNLYVADRGNNRIAVLSRSGYFTAPFPSVDAPSGVAVDANGNVAVTGTAGLTYEMNLAGMSPGGKYQTTLLASNFNTPYGVSFDPSGSMYIIDDNAQQLVRQSPMTTRFADDQTLSLVFVFDGGATLGMPSSSYDMNRYTIVDGGTCGANHTFQAGQSCTLKVESQVHTAGQSKGILKLLGTGSTTLATVPLQGFNYGASPVLLGGGQFGPLGLIRAGSAVAGGCANRPYDLYEVEPASGQLVEGEVNWQWRVVAQGDPVGVVSDCEGGAFYTDGAAGSLMKIMASGQTTRLAKNLKSPGVLAMDAGQNLFFYESGTQSIKEELALTGYSQTKTLATGLPGVTAMAIDSHDNLFVIEAGTTLLEFSATSGYSKPIQLYAGLVGAQMTIDALDNLYITDALPGNAWVLLLVASNGYAIPMPFPIGAVQPSAIWLAGPGQIGILDTANMPDEPDYKASYTLFLDWTQSSSFSLDQAILITNIGNADLDLAQMQGVYATGSWGYSSVNTCGNTLSAGSTCTDSYTFLGNKCSSSGIKWIANWNSSRYQVEFDYTRPPSCTP